MKQFEGEAESLLQNMRASLVTRAMVVATEVSEITPVLELCEQYPELYSAFAQSCQDEELEELSAEKIASLVTHPKMLAVGETGLDYHYCHEPLDWQRARFSTHIAAAHIAKKPVIVHSRDAAADTLRILKDADAGSTGFVLHCFCGDWDFAKKALDLGGYISFSGIVTFKSATDIQEAARHAPLDRILIETDSPYLAPVPLRGKRNEPAYVPHVARFMAELRGISLEEMARLTFDNTNRFFGLAS